MGYVVAIIIAILVVVFLFTVFPEFMWTLLATLVIVIIVALVQAKSKNPKETSSTQNSTQNKVVKEKKEKPLSAKELQRQKELEIERAAEQEKQKYENYLQEEEPVFKPFAEASNIERRFALETWLNERLKAIISIKNEIAFEQELLAHLRRKKEAYVHYGLDTTWLDERIDSSINKLSSTQQELSGKTIYLCEYKTQTYLGSQNLLRDFIQGYTQIKKEIFLNGTIEDAKWFDFNATSFVAWMPFCVLLADKRTLNVRLYMYNEVITSENATVKGAKEKTYSLRIVSKNGETIVFDKALPASKQSKMEQYKRVIAEKEKADVIKRMFEYTETPSLDVVLAEVAEENKKVEQEKCREFLSKAEPTARQKFKLSTANTTIAFGKVVHSIFHTYIDLLNELDKSEKHLAYLKKKYDAEVFLEDTTAYLATRSKMDECESLIGTQKQKISRPISVYQELTITETKEQNKYQKAFANIEREFSKAIKQIASLGVPFEPFEKFLKDKPMIEFSEDAALFFFPYFLVLLQKQKEKDSFAVKFLTYNAISFESSYDIVRLKYGESLPKGAEKADATWEHQRTDGSPDMRYRNNKVKYSYYVGVATLKVETFKKVFKYQTRQKANDIATSIKKYQQMLKEDISKVMVDAIHQSKEVPSLDTIALDMFNLDLQKKEEEKREKQRKLEEERAARKRAEEEQKAAQQRAEEERKQKLEALRLARLQREEEKRRTEQEQRAREERVQNELAKKERDEKMILEKQSDVKHREGLSYLATPKMLEEIVNSEVVLPIDDTQRKTITNSIARCKFIQKSLIDNCSQYLIYFADKQGNRISEQRVLNQTELNNTTDVSFELKSSNGFDSKEDYYLMIFDFASGAVIGALKYKINIAFANDFDF